MGRREYGTGSVHPQYRGSRKYWRAVVDVAEPGQRRRRIAVVRKTKSEALAALSDLQRRAQADQVAPDVSVGDWMAYYLNTIKAQEVAQGRLSQRTLDSYRQWARLYVTPHVGTIKLRKLKPQHVRQLVATLTEQGLSPRICNQAKDLLSRACKAAVGDDRLEKNPCEYASTTRFEAKLDDAPSPEQAEAILAANREHKLYPLVYMILLYGLRPADVRNLMWSDVNFASHEFTVRSKTKHGTRTLPMIADTEELLAQLAHSAQGPAVFTGHNNQPLNTIAGERWLLRRWHEMQISAGVPQGRMHAARHAAAIAMRARGVPIETISDVLGHSNIGITREVYLKADKDVARRALLSTLT